MEQEKKATTEVSKPPGFLRRYRVIFVAVSGIFALHLVWWRFVEAYVPVEKRPKQFEFLGKLDSLIQKKEEKN